MELVKRFKDKRKQPKLRETRFGVFAFISALLTLAYFNIVLINKDHMLLFSNVFLQAIPTLGVIAALLSFIRVNNKKTFALWALALYSFMLICVLVVAFFEFAIYTKP